MLHSYKIKHTVWISEKNLAAIQPAEQFLQKSQKSNPVIKKCVLVERKRIHTIESTESKTALWILIWRSKQWHFLIYLDGTKKWKPLLLLPVVLPAAPVTNRKKSPLLAALPAALATNKLFYSHELRFRRKHFRREHLKGYSDKSDFYIREVKRNETIFFFSVAHHRRVWSAVQALLHLFGG